MMKKRFVGLVLLLCLVLCCAGGLADETTRSVSTESDFLTALGNNSVSTINLTGSITLTKDVTIDRSVKILYDDDIAITGSNADITLTIAKDCEVVLGQNKHGTGIDFRGQVRVNVVNEGTIFGSTTFYGKVTNKGIISSSDRFYGEYEEMEGGKTYSTVTLTFEFGGVIVQEYVASDTERKTTITGTIPRGQELSNSITFDNTERWVTDVVKVVDSELVVNRKGFDLAWVDGDGDAFSLSGKAPDKDLTIYAKWTAKEGNTLHTLSYNVNNGTGTLAPQYFVADETFLVNPVGTIYNNYEGCRLLGWNTKPDGTGYGYGNGDTITLGNEDVTLYAQWTKQGAPTGRVFSVTYHRNDGSTTSDIVDEDTSLDYEDSPRKVKSPDEITSMTVPTDKVFAGWSINEDGSGTRFQAGDKVTLIDGGDGKRGVHLYAVWTNLCTVTFLDGFGGTTTATVESGQKAAKPTDPTHEDFTFQHWSKQGETAAFDFDSSITANTTLVAQWDAIPVSNENELRDAVASNPGKPIRLTKSINLVSNLDITGDITIDTNGNHVGCGAGVDGVSISPAGKLTLKSSKDGSEAASSFNPSILNQGILSLEGHIYAKNVSLMGSGSVLHTPYKDTKYPYMADVFVENSAQLEKVLGLADGETNHFFGVWLSKDIALENDVTLSKGVFLFLNGHTLSGNATLKLSADSGLYNTRNDGSPLGSVTCGLTIDDDAIIPSNLLVCISFETGTTLFFPTDQVIVRGQKAVAPTAPTDIGITLQRWSKQGETTEFDFNTSILENMTLVAEWDVILVSDADELRAAEISNPSKPILLTKSFELTGGLNVSNDVIIDLNGCQLTYDGENEIAINPGAKLTFQNSQSDNKKWSCVYPPINNEGTLAVEGYITIDDASLREGATIQHTPYDGSYPLVDKVRVDNSAALENALSLADGAKNYVVNVVLDANITLEKDVTLPANVTLYLEGRTLSGDKTLTLAEGSVVLNSMDNDDRLGCVTCGLVDNGADIAGILLCTVTFRGETVTDESQTVLRGQPVSKPKDPQNEGQIFAGWYLEGGLYDWDMPVTQDITLTAQWQTADAPAFTGLIDGKTYCGSVTFSVRANSLTRAIDDVSVTVNGTALTPNVYGAYTLKPAAGVQKVVATNTAGKSAVATVTVNDGHTWGAWASNGNDTHTRNCTVGGCSETETASCTGGKADCTDKAVCAECGSAYGTVDANAHAGLMHVPAKASTATEAGNSEYWHCEHCGKYFADAAATKEINQADTILPLQPEVPKTGDSAPLALWACLMLLGIGGLAAMRKRIHS